MPERLVGPRNGLLARKAPPCLPLGTLSSDLIVRGAQPAALAFLL